MKQKVVIAGGTGFIGSYCAEKFNALEYDVIIISRQNGHVHWDDPAAITAALENAELLLNLAGRSVDCRYNEKNKREILTSRTETTKALGEAIQRCENPPPLWINAGTATIYRDSMDRPMTEKTGEIGSGFSVDVAKAWEAMFYSFTLPQTRRVVLRTTIALGNGGGAMKPFMLLTRFGLGGKQGDGRQMFSWIHVEDLYRIVRFVQDNPQIQGPVNVAAPDTVTNAQFMKTLRNKMHRTVGIPTPEPLLKIGAFFIRTEPELLLKSRYVVPEKLLENGFEFKYPTTDMAVDEIVNSAV